MLTILSLVAAINGLLTWIGHGFGINHLTLQLIIGYIFYPITFFMGVPRGEILRVAQLLATKLIANEFAGYLGMFRYCLVTRAVVHKSPLCLL